MTKDYIIRAALRDDANEGWVWIENIPSRSLIKITSVKHNRSVICQTRKLDQNFLVAYNDSGSRRYKIHPGENTIVISEWYRSALGNLRTTGKSSLIGKEPLNVQLLTKCIPWWQLRASLKHPDIVVRLGVCLGILSACLGVIGVILGILSLILGVFPLFIE